MNNIPRLSIVVPCYNEEAVIDHTAQVLLQLIGEMADKGVVSVSSRVLFVDDGSTDATWQHIVMLHDKSSQLCGLKLAANVGHQNALIAGMETEKQWADAVITIDADLQDDVNVIPEMIDSLTNGGCDIVYGVRRKRTTDTWFKRTSAQLFYRLMQWLGVKTIYNHADFRLMSRRAVAALCSYDERNLFLRGMVPMVGYKSTTVAYDRSPRQAGETKYPLRKMANFAIDGITSFSVKPVRMVLMLGVMFLFVSLLILIYVLHAYMVNSAVPGWSSLILSVWFTGGCILIGLGIVGEYIGKIYIEVKHRPRYNIETTLI